MSRSLPPRRDVPIAFRLGIRWRPLRMNGLHQRRNSALVTVEYVFDVVEGTEDILTQETNHTDNDRCDERNEQAVLNGGSALFIALGSNEGHELAVELDHFNHLVSANQHVRCISRAPSTRIPESSLRSGAGHIGKIGREHDGKKVKKA